MFTKEVYYTKDLSIFKVHDYNTRDTGSHVLKLAQSMTKYGFAKDRPLLVDKDMKVLDGKQRLAAAKIANVGVYWEHSKNESQDDQIPIYALNKTWEIDNWINYHAAKKDEICIKLKNLATKYALTFNELCIFAGIGATDASAKIKEGNFSFDAEAKEKLLLKRLSLINIIEHTVRKYSTECTKFLNYLSFKKAVITLSLIPGFKETVFLNKLELTPEKIVKRGSIEEYVKAFVYVYNVRNRYPIKYKN